MKRILILLSISIFSLFNTLNCTNFKLTGQFFIDSSCKENLNINCPQPFNNSIYFIYALPEVKRDSNIVSYFRVGEQNEKFNITVPNFGISNTRYNNFLIDNRYIIVSDLNNCFIFKNDTSKPYLTKIFNTKRIMKKNCIYLISDKLYIISDDFINDSLMLYWMDLNSFKTDSICFEMQKSKEYLMLSPRKPYDLNKNLIAISEMNEYSIKLYDINTFSLKFEIHREFDFWGKLINPYPDSIWVKKPGVFHQFINNKLKYLSLIQKIFFITDNDLLVIWNDNPDSNCVMTNYDVWNIGSIPPKLVRTFKYKKYSSVSDNFDIETFSHLDRYYSNGKFYSIEYIPINIDYFNKKTVKEFKNFLNDFSEFNNPIYSLFEWELYEK